MQMTPSGRKPKSREARRCGFVVSSNACIALLEKYKDDTDHGVVETESLISGGLLKQDMLDGSEEQMPGVAGKSLPVRNKAHVFEGLDMDQIREDVLWDEPKKGDQGEEGCVEKGPVPVEEGVEEEGGEEAVDHREVPQSSQLDGRLYREFVREVRVGVQLTQQRRLPPPLRYRSQCQPPSYNGFLSYDPSTGHSTGHTAVVRSALRSEMTVPLRPSCADLVMVRAHIERVRELLGRKPRSETVQSETDQGRKASTNSRRLKTRDLHWPEIA